eukprot:TRINITY_DN4041_c0_g1_i8.p2 TRINITY_DN4041_c0_g1~~TRINITY_DN4041_c0_g1_i8.p2  ORF type:complete len:170 (+),score=20.66 TRINITY_DN4041_c0_g1_i8:799-1308(+)
MTSDSISRGNTVRHDLMGNVLYTTPAPAVDEGVDVAEVLLDVLPLDVVHGQVQLASACTAGAGRLLVGGHAVRGHVGDVHHRLHPQGAQQGVVVGRLHTAHQQPVHDGADAARALRRASVAGGRRRRRPWGGAAALALPAAEADVAVAGNQLRITAALLLVSADEAGVV